MWQQFLRIPARKRRIVLVFLVIVNVMGGAALAMLLHPAFLVAPVLVLMLAAALRPKES